MTVVRGGIRRRGMAALGRDEFDVVLVDVRMPDYSGLDVLRWARATEIDTEFIVLTGHADVETAVEAMRLGAYDFVAKPWKNVELLEVVRKAAEKKALRRENSCCGRSSPAATACPRSSARVPRSATCSP